MRATAYEKARVLAAAQKNEAALIAFEEACRKEPGNFKAVFGRGLMLQRLGRHAEAIASFSGALRLQPRIAEVHYSRALSLKDMGRFAEALRDLDAAIGLNAGYVDAEYARGVCLKDLERFEEAHCAFSRVLSQCHYPEASHGRGAIRYVMADYDGAIEDFSDCISAGLDSYEVRSLRGLALHRRGRHAGAIEDLSFAIALRPEEGSTYLHRWQVYKALGDEAAAAADFESVRKLLDQNREPETI